MNGTYRQLILYAVTTFCLLSYYLQWGRGNTVHRESPAGGSSIVFDSGYDDSKVYLVDTVGCKIYSANHTKVLQLSQKQICNPTITVVDNRHLKYNTDNQLAKEYTCCYHTIERLSQRPLDYNSDADWLIRHADECKQIPQTQVGIELTGEFVHVTCYKEAEQITYVYEHHFAVFPPSEHSNDTKKKVKRWKEEKSPLPYNILILGLDSVSRLNMMQWLPGTREFLKQNDFVEMRGFTKIGPNTFPNVMGALLGMLPTKWEPEYQYTCNGGRKQKLDDCPFIWKNFSERGYVTALIEDSPGIANFNYLKTGFVDQPVDYYFRPFAIAYAGEKTKKVYKECTGGLTQTELLFKYIEEFVMFMGEENVPYFLHSWLTSLAHDNAKELKAYDKFFEDFFTKIVHNSSLIGTNTIVLFMSDHGYIHGKHRSTPIGYYEASLPFFFIRLPPSLKSSHPAWYENLRTNSRRLTSPLDLHATYEDVLSLAFPNEILNFTHENRSPKNRQVYSFFEPAPLNRTCDSAGIQQIYCRCGVLPEEADKETSIKAEIFFQAVIKQVNAILAPKIESRLCWKLSLKRVKYSRELGHGEAWNNFGRLIPFQTFLVGVEAEPANPEFEATVRSFENGTVSVMGPINRINSYENQSDCMEDYLLKNYCVCKGSYQEIKLQS